MHARHPRDRRRIGTRATSDLSAKRPLCNEGYYETFNRDDVELVSVAQNPSSPRTRDRRGCDGRPAGQDDSAAARARR
jgi:hypothetical protein